MIETIGKQGAFSLRRIFARHMAREAGLKVMSPDNPRQLARARMDKGGDRVPPQTRSLAYRLRLQAPDRSLTDQDVADVRRGVEAAATKLGAELRS